jgi:Fur family ferric uptake transcriptional regulator
MCLHDVAIPDVALPEGFTLSSANFVLKGICAECQQQP